MAENNNKSSEIKNPFEEMCEIYILFFDETRGHIPLLIYPSEKLIENRKFMRPIKYHPIWFLDVQEQGALDHIDLEYKKHTFMAKKFLTKSKRKKRRAGLEEETPETIVIILSLPTDLDIFGDDLIRNLTNEIRSNFEEKFTELIIAEIANEEIIKTPKIKKNIEKGKVIKTDLIKLIRNIGNNYFSKVIKQADASSIKKQKAISFLYLKGMDFSHISGEEALETFSSIKMFDPSKKSDPDLTLKTPFNITDITVIDDSQELEILVKKNNDKEYKDLRIIITHVKDFFEKELMNQVVDTWFKDEELLFISPIIPHINEYLFFIIEEKNKKKLLSKKIDLNFLK